MRASIIIIIICLLWIISCKKTSNDTMTMTVIKDCTGTYLRYNNKDHLVCNEDKLDIYENETIVSASILKDDNCYSDRAHCAALHRYEIAEGNFWVAKIKN